jgi:GTPase SAR1 family protein
VNILIVGNKDTGKSNLANMLKNDIFKLDKEATIIIDDSSLQNGNFGSGHNIHNIKVCRTEEVSNLNDYDVRINIVDGKFKEWFDNL